MQRLANLATFAAMPSARPIAVLLVDDHTLVRRGLRSILGAQPGIMVVGEAADGLTAVASSRRLAPAVVVMDVTLPELNGIDATRRITEADGRVRVLMLSMHANEVYVRESLKAGASGYVLKDGADTELVAGIDAVASGRRYFSPSIERLLIEGCLKRAANDDAEERFWSLTGREREVMQLIAEGRNTRQIARMLGVAVATVASHRAATMEKLGLHNTAEIVRFAVRSGVVR